MKFLYFLPALMLLACSAPDSSPAAAGEAHPKGHELFLVNCASCHHPDRTLVGPPLREALGHWPDRAQLHRYVQNPEGYMNETGDQRLKKLLERYGTLMPGFPKLSRADVDSIAAYIANAPQSAVQ